MATSYSLPLCEKVKLKNSVHRIIGIITLVLLFMLVGHRLLCLRNHGFCWLQATALFCELWFTFTWAITLQIKWTLVDFKMYPDRLLKRVAELPNVDMFVTTADPAMEPPIITINTVLSLLAVDYPANKLACYVSDDGCSPLIVYSLTEAVKFAKLWVPFCKKYNVQVRAPFRYFLDNSSVSNGSSTEFRREWTRMKAEYDQLCSKIEDATRTSIPLDRARELAEVSNTERGNHPTIIKVIWENKEGLSYDLPHLVYISREKSPKHPHHFKAGAMNVLVRVSGLMTNAPYMLNVDCDMYVNNPSIVLCAMCALLDHKSKRDTAFVQTPQCFYDGLEDDPFGNQLTVPFEYIGRGMAAVQGIVYAGTGCFHRRKVIYGQSPDSSGKLSDKELVAQFGNSNDLIVSASDALKENIKYPSNLSDSIPAAKTVAGSAYEYGTSWGNKIGWIYGSATEDLITGLTIHNRGWKSIYYAADPRAFLGCSPPGGPASMTQQKRWATGQLEILLSKNCPLFGFLYGKLQLRQCLTYAIFFTWGLRAIPELCYAVLPAYCIITNSQFLPKIQEPVAWIPVLVFAMHNLQYVLEYLGCGLSVKAWWNNHKMTRITTMCAGLFGFLSVFLKLLGLSETAFELTRKDQPSTSTDDEPGRITFDESPIFLPGTIILMLQVTALAMILLGLQPEARGGEASGLLEVACSVWLVLCFWPFLRGMFGKGKYGIPSSTLYKSGAFAMLFVLFCRKNLATSSEP